jgi:crossover junction endodeoxyribonuclease RuvC
VTILGIDPGTADCGFGIVQGSGDRLRAVEFGSWRTSAKQRPELRLKAIFDGVTGLIEEFKPRAVAVEESFVGVDGGTVCGYGRAEKAQVQRMVMAILGLKQVPTPHHASDALAVAICHALAPPLLRATG